MRSLNEPGLNVLGLEAVLTAYKECSLSSLGHLSTEKKFVQHLPLRAASSKLSRSIFTHTVAPKCTVNACWFLESTFCKENSNQTMFPYVSDNVSNSNELRGCSCLFNRKILKGLATQVFVEESAEANQGQQQLHLLWQPGHMASWRKDVRSLHVSPQQTGFQHCRPWFQPSSGRMQWPSWRGLFGGLSGASWTLKTPKTPVKLNMTWWSAWGPWDIHRRVKQHLYGRYGDFEPGKLLPSQGYGWKRPRVPRDVHDKMQLSGFRGGNKCPSTSSHL